MRCNLGDIPNGATARIVVTGTVDPNTPLAADLTNTALFTVNSPDGSTSNNTITVDTEVYTLADVGLRKTGPSSVTAGQTVSYTIVLSNTGPSTARTVDMKELLPAGVTYSSGTTTQGACVSGICQLGDVAVGQVITMVVTGTVGSNVTGVITNTAQVFADTADTNATNNTSSCFKHGQHQHAAPDRQERPDRSGLRGRHLSVRDRHHQHRAVGCAERGHHRRAAEPGELRGRQP